MNDEPIQIDWWEHEDEFFARVMVDGESSEWSVGLCPAEAIGNLILENLELFAQKIKVVEQT